MRTALLFTAVAAIVVGLMLFAATAPAATITRADGVTPIPRLQAVVAAAPTPSAPGIVRVRFGAAFTYYEPAGRTIYVRTGQPITNETLLHELGHDYSRHALTDAGFAAWAATVGMPLARDALGHDPGHRGTVYIAEEFWADFYTLCATRGGYYNYGPETVRRNERGIVRGPYGFEAPRLVLRAACARIWRFETVR